MEARFEELIEGFVTGNIGISETFLSIPLAAALQKNLLLLNAESLMLQAGIVNAIVRDNAQKIRGDKTHWLEENSKNDAELEFMETVGQFMGHLNRTCFTGLNACEFHYALYEKGTAYGRHKDRLRNDDNRKFTLISYGQLLIHHDDESTTSISPDNQKTIFFQSDVLEHEVLLANRKRMSISGWLKRI